MRSKAGAFATVAVICVGILAAVGIFATLSAGGSTHDVELDGVDGDRLADFGYRLLSPAEDASISASDAESIATFGGLQTAPVKEVVLLRVVNDTAAPPLDTLAWAINFDTSALEPGPVFGPGGPDRPAYLDACRGPLEFRVTFIDADTGEFLFTTQGGGEEIPCDTPRPDDASAS